MADGAVAIVPTGVIGARIRERRLGLGLTQRRLADQARVSKRTIEHAEHAVHRPRLFSLRAIAGALGMDPRDLGAAPARGSCAPGLGWPLEAPGA